MALYQSDLPHLQLLYRGKTRDTYDIEGGRLLILATDRLSTHNIVHESAIPNKGYVLTALTVFWFSHVIHHLPNHLVAYGSQIYDYLPGETSDYPADLPLRAIVVRRLKIIPVEFIYRAYLCGSLYRDYYSQGLPNPYEVDIIQGLPKTYKFDSPIFTPTEKSDTDDPLPALLTMKNYPAGFTLSKRAFDSTRAFANINGVEMLDGKWEIGVDDAGQPFLVDEVATPDSSRFALLGAIEEGKDPPWLDKQLARDEAERLWGGSTPKGSIRFSPLLVNRLSDTYQKVFHLITKSKLEVFQAEYLS